MKKKKLSKELRAYIRGRSHGKTDLILALQYGQTTLEEEIDKLEKSIKE